MRRSSALVFSVLVIFCVTLSLTGPVHGQEVELIRGLEAKLDWIEYRLALERWRVAMNGSSDSLYFFEHLLEYTMAQADIRPMVQKVESGSFDEETKRKARVLGDKAMRYVVDGRTPVAGLLDTLRSAAVGITFTLDGARASRAVLDSIVANDPARSRREQAYRALRSGTALADQLARLFRLRNQQARREGFNNYFNMVMSSRSYSLDEYRALLKQVDEATREPYQSLLTRLKTRLRVDHVEPWDLEYAYREIRLAVDSRLGPEVILPLSLATFDSIGVSIYRLPIFLGGSVTSSDGVAPVSFTVRPPHDLRVVGGVGSGHFALREMLAALGEAVYGCHIHQEELLFRRPMEGAFGYSVGSFFRMFVDDPRWLTEFAGLGEQLTADFVAARRDLALMELRQLLLWQYFELEAYGDAGRDLNKVYWDLYEKYLLMSRHDDLSPWASDPNLALAPGGYRDRMIGRLIAAQTWSYMLKVNGTVIDNRDTRSFLIQNYFRFGRLYGWPELVKRGTGESLNPAYYLTRLGL